MRVDLITALSLIFLLVLTPNISAVSVSDEESNSDGPLYSVIGKERVCSVYADETLEINFEENVLIDNISMEICGDINALINTFDSEWNPYMEYKDGSFVCSFEEGCLLEVYCCPDSECTDDKVCKESKGMFSKCKKVQCEEWKNGGYKCNVNGLEEKIPYQYSEISYCSKSTNNLLYFSLGILLIIILVVIYFLKKK